MTLKAEEAIRRRIKRIAGWTLNRLTLVRDERSVATFDFGSKQVRELKALMARFAIERPEIRTINWLIPQVKHPLFAGVNTALRFADYFTRVKKVHNRILFYGGPNGNLLNVRGTVGAMFPSLGDSTHFLDEREPGKLPVSDISIATAWDSAYLLLHAENTRGKFYFVQDFEPLFYPASASYGLAEATYRMGYWGIANTHALGSFLRHSYGMKVKSFEPAVDPTVFYPSPNRSSQPIKIFFYGRPRNPRNGFMLGIEALKLVKRQFKEEVQIVSAGGEWNPSDFGAKGEIENLGLLPTIEEVASLYRACHIGLVFMFTKHPSYQPIQMIASGMAVVANENPALRAIARNEANLLLVEPTVSSVAEGISSLVYDADLRNRLAAEGLKISQQTRWDTEIESVSEFIFGKAQNAGD